MTRSGVRCLLLLAGAALLAVCLSLAQSPVTRKAGGERPNSPALISLPVPDVVKTRPSEAVVRAVERVARGALPEPFFADSRTGAAFLEEWQGRLAEGKVLLAQPDEFDAGAENGHLVPLQLWLDSGTAVMGLAGEAAFESGPGGLKLSLLRLAPIKLAVSSWSGAAGRLRQAQTGIPEAQPVPGPFYGSFRFRAGTLRWSVDAVTGAVTVE